MSWDSECRKEKCRCEKGFLIQEIISDDWNRIKTGKPFI